MSLFELFDDGPLETGVESRHRLLLASAGTGKTFRLANHFAALLVSGVGPESVLATTFTRKAAGEILDRVLGRLADGARTDERGARTRSEVQGALPGTPEVGPAVYRRVLFELVRSVDRFQVRTLDSFFVRLARAFAAELDIRAEWRIASAVEDRRLLSEDLARMLDELEPGERLELVRAIVSSSTTRGAAGALVTAIEGGDQLARVAESGAWGRVEPLPSESDEVLFGAIVTARDFELPKNKEGKPNGHWKNGHADLSDLLSDITSLEELHAAVDGLSAALGKGPAKAARESWAAGQREASFRGGEIPGDLFDAVVVLDRFVVAECIARLIERNAAMRSLLERFSVTDRALRAETGAYRFQDFPLALLDGPVRGDREQWLSDLGFRLDGRIDHLLLDEFQDTAPLQWWLVEPLAAEILSDGTGTRSFFCVGDVKQSIYGWRGGDPRLLAGLGERYGLAAEAMAVSYRSASVVLETVNTVFAGIERSAGLAKADRAAAREATSEWLAGFDEHRAAREDLRGEARVWHARALVGDEGRLDAAIALAVERVALHHEQRPDASIGVLVRAKSNIARLRYLLKERGVESSDEGGNPLTDSVGVTFVLALLQLADHPGDGVAALQVARAGWAAPFDLALEVAADPKLRPAALARVARAAREAVLREGYGPFCDARARELLPRVDAWDARRLEQLVDLALGYDESAGLRPIDFVEFVREERVPDPTASPVKVMTIHASKGLEFDVVICPELGKDIRLTPGEVLGWGADPYGAPELLTVRPKKEWLAHHPDLACVYADAEKRAMTDALSSLYVAMTRAVHALELILPALPAKPSEALSYASLVQPCLPAEPGRAALAEATDADASETDRATLAWEHPNSAPDWTLPDERGPEVDFVPEPAFELAAGVSPAAAPTLAPSSLGRAAAARQAAAEGSAGQRIGTLVHAILADVEWVEPGSPAFDRPRALRRMRAADQGEGAEALHAEALARVERALASPEVARLFERPDESTRALRERTFDVELTDLDQGPGQPRGRVRGTIDRLHVRTANGAVTGATVVEFKTGAAPSAEAVAEAARPQIELYCRTIAALFALAPGQVDGRLVWLPQGGAEPRAIALAVDA